MSQNKDNYIPAAPAAKGDEDVLAGIARRHAAGLDSRQADAISLGRDESAAPVTLQEPPPVKQAPRHVATPAGSAAIRPAIRRPGRRVSPKQRLVIQIAVVAALTALAVALYLLTR